MSEGKRNSGLGIFIILILLLLGLNAWLFYNAYQNKKEKRATELRIEEVDSLNTQLQTQYADLMEELEAQRGESAQKDSLITALQSELTDQKAEIEELLKSKNYISSQNKKSDQMLNEAKARIALLENERDIYIAKLDSVSTAYNSLVENYEQLEIQYSGEVKQVESLAREKDSVVGIGSTILANNITVTGVRSKGKGKEVDDQNAKKTERLKICFDLLKNKLSAGKQQTIYVKVIDPNGITLFDSVTGSGQFDNKENSEDSRYTIAVTMDYTGEELQSYCVYWSQSSEFIPGEYQVSLYHNGYSVGSTAFTLKKPIL